MGHSWSLLSCDISVLLVLRLGGTILVSIGVRSDITSHSYFLLASIVALRRQHSSAGGTHS